MQGTKTVQNYGKHFCMYLVRRTHAKSQKRIISHFWIWQVMTFQLTSQSSGAILQYTDVTHNVIPLENTLIGYMLNGLNWCGKLSSPEPNFEACPEWNNCVNNSMRSFWRAASESYAMKAHGEVTVMLNGSARVKAFRTNSIFGEIELGKLDNKRVTSVHLWIMDNVDGPDKESCSIGSVSELEKVLKEKKIMYSCKDNYKPVKMLQCLFKVDHPSCELDSKL
ncbi:ADP-ribosyl cyclase/cyclic ADP-ribose hydrolase 1-like isoform X2 [Carcharodon carcharias]|uniref:ADP-ribosyl cyclase/cyclic ADP-ribose hydrolase 1-like isoform X2 n=1 Tax=Carcharodon carcharias TaxID=13397 RepID=UPI001B7F17BC|nr:ADP-ribosyl cyclase/cyclic ADP-ribose hydrolase 1-like isoform X2 [Carcharodon carcharias]